MSFNLRALVVCMAVVGLCASTAYADDVEQEMQRMRDMVLQLQDQINDQQSRLDEQSDRLEEAGIEGRGASSGLSSFLEQTDFGGWVAVNYNYNFRGDDNNHLIQQSGGDNEAVSPSWFQQDNNSFKVDQVWFSMDKDVSAESRGGFHSDIVFGETARIQGFNNNGGKGGNDDVTVFTAYVSWLAPVGDGLRFDMGEMWTLIGAEVVAAPDNLNITRGIVWGLQPVTNTGILASYDFGPVGMKFGILNDVVGATATDTDRNKAITGQLSYNSDLFSAAGSVVWGSVSDKNGGCYWNPQTAPGTPCNDDGKKDLGIFDVLLTSDPTDNITVAVDYDFVWSRPRGGQDANTHGISIMSRWGITDKMGIAGRFESVIFRPQSSANDNEAYSITGTFDYALTDNLTSRFEVRYDWVQDGNIYYSADSFQGNPTEDDNVMVVAEMIYQF